MERRREPSFLNTCDFNDWLATAEAALEALLNDREKAAKDSLEHWKAAWKESIWQEYKKNFLLKDNEFGRCAYCEGKYWAGDSGDAEHYRPKGEVTEERSCLSTHRGYYWLAYEWQNIILACSFCNTYHTDSRSDIKHPGKLNEFPVKNSRVFEPHPDPDKWWEELHAEEPLLLHPYWDDPEDHFALGRRRGYIRGITEKGKVTIEVCDLNRQVLVEERLNYEEQISVRLLKVVTGGGSQGWFSEGDRYSTYLNCRLDQELVKLLGCFAAPGQPKVSPRAAYREQLRTRQLAQTTASDPVPKPTR